MRLQLSVLAFLTAVDLLPDRVAGEGPPSPTAGPPPIVLETEHCRLELAADGRGAALIDRRTGTDHAAPGGAPWARVRAGGAEHPLDRVDRLPSPGGAAPGGAPFARCQRLRLSFGASGVVATVAATESKGYLVLEVVAVDGEAAEELVLPEISLRLTGSPGEPFAACALALDLRTNVLEIPGPNSRLRASSYRRFGFAGARAAIVACPPAAMREILKDVVTAAPEIPRSTLGGPWALDAEAARGSYLFNFGGLNESTVDAWIALARRLGFRQIDFHGGGSFRFGDCRPNPETYPKGFESLKATIDRLHDAGILAGLHTYAFFMDKGCPWVTPVPDPRLGSDRAFTLAAAVSPDATTIPVVEDTKGMSAITGFFVRNSATLRIGEELVTYAGVRTEPPFAFTGCGRGAHGTRAGAHEAGAPAHHLKECFGLFSPDGEGTLLEEVAARTAEAYNRCGFDMIYLDALDGEDVLGGAENGWHYGSRYVFEIAKRLDRPALMEMSTFHHHLWYVRSRMGAWDHPTRSHKRFIDIHCAANEDLRRRFLPGQLGWWAVKTWTGHQGEPTFVDDIEYLCGKALGNGSGLSVMGFDPSTIDSRPILSRLADVFRSWEEIRLSDAFDDGVKARLREPGREFTLSRDAEGRPRVRPASYHLHRVEGPEAWSRAWTVENPFVPQAPSIRVEALSSAAPWGSADSVLVADPARPGELGQAAAAAGVSMSLSAGSGAIPETPGATAASLRASSEGRVDRRASWARATKVFDPPLDLSRRQALGVWVHGDGSGAVLNFQLTCPEHLVAGVGDHYVVVDFTGWRYQELIEPEGERYSRYSWPYGNAYAIYRENIEYSQVRTLGIWLNDVPPGSEVACRLGPIRALPLATGTLRNPSVTIGGKTLVFPVDVETGAYLEFRPPAECALRGPDGAVLREVIPRGELPILGSGTNEVTFGWDGADAAAGADGADRPRGAAAEPRPRARVTLGCLGEPL